MSIKSWFSRLLGGADSPPEAIKTAPASSTVRAQWLEEGDSGNPFPVRLLDLMENLSMLSTTTDPEIAAKAVSWRPGVQREIAVDLVGDEFECELRYPAARELPPGMLYRPEQMEDKWVIAYRDGRVAAARSWTGATAAVAHARHEDDALILDHLTLTPGSGFEAFGDPVAAFDWLMHTHALGRRVPLPVSVEGAEALAAQPLAGFSLYGRHLFCAAIDYPLDSAEKRLFSDGDLVAAVAAGDRETMMRVIAAGASVSAPCRFNDGGTALHLAVHLHPELVEPLLKAGADVNVASLRGSTPLMAATSGDATCLESLIEAGAEIDAMDSLGFGALHVAAQFGSVNAIRTLVQHGADVAGRTERGLTPLHIAAGSGQASAVEWLLDHGVEPTTDSPFGDALKIAEDNGHEAVVAVLRAR